ncbi:MAG: hypothetical protein U5K31_06865 [Balneolaceae bacterium]|nr:hypothetical protein [Balneolaceae bacterium]
MGDTVYFHVTNLEQDWDVPHGFTVRGANTSELLIMPGETRTLVWTPDRVGVAPFYCTDFCSALRPGDAGIHQGFTCRLRRADQLRHRRIV